MLGNEGQNTQVLINLGLGQNLQMSNIVLHHQKIDDNFKKSRVYHFKDQSKSLNLTL